MDKPEQLLRELLATMATPRTRKATEAWQNAMAYVSKLDERVRDLEQTIESMRKGIM